jgi:hypothetical protein
MKQTVLLLTMVLVSVTGFSQEKKYKKSMNKNLEMLEQASTPESRLDCAVQFEQIAAKYDKEWIPSYYAAQTLTLASFEGGDATQKDQWLDRAQEALDKAKALEPEESEILVVQAMTYLARMAVDPYSRGPLYFEDFNYTLQKAKELNPENPRTYYLEALLTLNLPLEMGGGPDSAKPIFQKAAEKFEAFENEDPYWPDWGKELNQAELDQLD